MPTVQSRHKPLMQRKAQGYSCKELKEAGITMQRAKQLKIRVDKRRKSSYADNVKELKHG